MGRAELTPTPFYSSLMDATRAHGFAIAGALDLEQSQEAIQEHIQKYDDWLEKGHSGKMDYLRRGRDRRADPRAVFPDAESILCVAVPYPRSQAGAPSPAQGARYARYLQGRDYHEAIPERLEAMMLSLKSGNPTLDLRWKVCVDTSAVLERSWATLAGLGWIGKNTLLIHPKHGSYLFLGSVLINQKTGLGPSPLPDYCGHCTRCLSACPTGALVQEHELNSNRCISYWTLEKRGDLELPEDDKKSIGTWVAGCDLCQEICPFNLKPTKEELALKTVPVSGSTELNDWIALLQEDETQYRSRIQNSSLNRVKPAMFRRNLAIALANAAPQLMPSFAQECASQVEAKSVNEPDDVARAEWIRCLSALRERAAQSPQRNP